MSTRFGRVGATLAGLFGLLLVVGCDPNGRVVGDDTSVGETDVPVAVSDVVDPDAGSADVGAVDLVETPDVVAEDDIVSADIEGTDVVQEEGLPRTLPFEFVREADGEPIPAADVTAFSVRVTGLWRDVDYFRWLLRTSTGVDASTGMDDFLAWYNDVVAVKSGDTVTFQQKGGEHNQWIAGSKVLSSVVNGYLLTGDPTLALAAEQYCKGLTASVKGFVWGEDDPAPFLMARSIFPNDHEFTLDAERWGDDGRRKAVEFHEMYREEVGWNAESFAWPENPTWGSIWITNMRSKDDVCAIVRATAFLPYAAEDAEDGSVRAACRETWETMVGFNRDIVDHGYYIRTKDREGNAYLVTDQDLGNYAQYAGVDVTSECTARLATDLIGYGEPLSDDCEDGFGSMFEAFATVAHYYNYPIVWDYHLAALTNALVQRHSDVAYRMLQGMAARMDAYLDPESEEPGADDSDWSRDMAVVLVKAASAGLPLTAREARHVQQHWDQAVVEFSEWPRWDLWDESVPDGEYGRGGGFRPSASPEGIRVESVALLLEYCNSPFKNPAGAQFVDCDVLRDAQRWGEAR